MEMVGWCFNAEESNWDIWDVLEFSLLLWKEKQQQDSDQKLITKCLI